MGLTAIVKREARQAQAVKLFSALNFFWGFWAAPFSFFVAIYLSGTGISDSTIGLLFGLSALAGVITALPSGLLSDRFNVKHVMLFGLIITAPFYLAITFTDSFVLLVLLFILDSVGANLYGVGADSALYRTINSGKSKAFGVIHLLYNLGVAASLLACGYLIALIGFRALGFLFLLPILIVMLLVLRLPRSKLKLDAQSAREYLEDFKQPQFLLFAIVVFLLAYHWGTEKTSIPLYASNVLHFSSEQLGMLFSANILVYAIAGFFAGGFIHSSKHRARIFALGLLISALGSILYSFSYDFGSALLSRILHDAGDGLLAVSIMLAVATISKRERLGGVVGAMSIIYVFANFTGATASGILNQFFGYAAAIQVSAILTLASGGLLALALLTKTVRSPFPSN